MPDAEKDAAVKAAIRTILPGLRVANYVERWSPASPAVRALTILSEYIGEGSIVAGDLVDPDVPTAHACRPEGRATPPAASAVCGVTFQHDSHGYLDDDGRTRVCDGGSNA